LRGQDEISLSGQGVRGQKERFKNRKIVRVMLALEVLALEELVALLEE